MPPCRPCSGLLVRELRCRLLFGSPRQSPASDLFASRIKPHASVASHADGNHHPRKQHGVAQGEQWKHFWNVFPCMAVSSSSVRMGMNSWSWMSLSLMFIWSGRVWACQSGQPRPATNDLSISLCHGHRFVVEHDKVSGFVCSRMAQCAPQRRLGWSASSGVKDLSRRAMTFVKVARRRAPRRPRPKKRPAKISVACLPQTHCSSHRPRWPC